MAKVILLHGNGGGTGQDNWFPWLKAELDNLGIECLSPNFPDPVQARASIWLPFIQNELKADSQTILVGHSSGAVAAMRYAENHELLGSILVGVCYTDLGDEDEKASGYYDDPWNWNSIKVNQNWIDIFASKDDPYIDISEPRYIKDQINADYHELQDQGHFGEDKGKKDFPELLEVLKNHLNI